MSEAIIVALITAGASVIVQIMISNSSRQQMDAKLDKALAVQETRLTALTEQVAKHNQLVERTYSLEERMSVAEEKQKVADHRISDLERKDAS